MEDNALYVLHDKSETKHYSVYAHGKIEPLPRDRKDWYD